MLNKVKSDGRGARMGNALAKEYMRQLRQEMEERKGKQLARGEELANIEL